MTGDLLICCHGIREEALLPVAVRALNRFLCSLITTPTTTPSADLVGRVIMGEVKALVDNGDLTTWPDVGLFRPYDKRLTFFAFNAA